MVRRGVNSTLIERFLRFLTLRVRKLTTGEGFFKLNGGVLVELRRFVNLIRTVSRH